MTIELIVAVVTAIISTGILSEVYRSFRDRKKVDLDLFYPTWKEEIQRLHNELAELRALVLALSEEVSRLGGDPIAVRRTVHDNRPPSL